MYAVSEARKVREAVEERHADLAAVRVAAQDYVRAGIRRVVELVRVVREQDGGRAIGTIAHGLREVGAPCPRVVDRGQPELRSAPVDDDPLVAEHRDPTRAQHRDQGLAVSEVVVIAHRREDAVRRAKRSDDGRDVLVEVGAARHHVSGDDREIREGAVGRA